VEYDKPLVTVHHLEAHCLIARLAARLIRDNGATPEETDNDWNNSDNGDATDFKPCVDYPFLALVSEERFIMIIFIFGYTTRCICSSLSVVGIWRTHATYDMQRFG
jgi:hypothetical protein